MEISYHIKPFDELSRDELYDILAARFEVFVCEQNCVAMDADYVDQLSDHLMVKSREGELLAYLRIIPPDIEYHGNHITDVYLGRVLCREKARGQGVAQNMINRALEFIKGRWPTHDIVLSSQVYVKSLYEKCGFKTVGEEYIEADIPHIRMICRPLA